MELLICAAIPLWMLYVKGTVSILRLILEVLNAAACLCVIYVLGFNPKQPRLLLFYLLYNAFAIPFMLLSSLPRAAFASPSSWLPGIAQAQMVSGDLRGLNLTLASGELPTDLNNVLWEVSIQKSGSNSISWQ